MYTVLNPSWLFYSNKHVLHRKDFIQDRVSIKLKTNNTLFKLTHNYIMYIVLCIKKLFYVIQYVTFEHTGKLIVKINNFKFLLLLICNISL